MCDEVEQFVTDLSNGVQMPLIGFGTGGKRCSDEDLNQALRDALDAGYRMIDTAYVYGNEHVIGEVISEYIASGRLKRSDLFITTKVCNQSSIIFNIYLQLYFTAHRKEYVQKLLKKQLEALQLDYIDLYLMHGPTAFKRQKGSFKPELKNDRMIPDHVDYLDTWMAMEEVYCAGLARAIGVSNFNEKQLQRLCKHAEIQPHNLQIEIHLHLPQVQMLKLCRKANIVVTAYAPLGCPGRLNGVNFQPNRFDPLRHPTVVRLAHKHEKSAAQVLLRQLVQAGICVIPKSLSTKHMEQNLEIFDFELSDDDIDELESVEQRTRLYILDRILHHPSYPFKEDLHYVHYEALVNSRRNEPKP